MSEVQKGINDFKTWCFKNNKLDMLEEYDLEKNSLLPDEISFGARKKYWWKGKECGHSYEALINQRTSNLTGCPYCCNSHAKVLVGFNDLETTNPEVLKLWDYEKNRELKPSMVMKGQHRKVWWKCELGHSWEATIYHIVGGRGCPICSKESKTSFPEQAVFYYVSKQYNDTVLGDRKELNGKEIDIFIPSIRVGIEFDGSRWHKDIEKDIEKNNLCSLKKIHLIRIRDVNCPKIVSSKGLDIIEHLDYSDNSLMYCLHELERILNINFDIDLEKDRSLIYSSYLKSVKEKSLEVLFPDIAKEWYYEKNGELLPCNVSAKSDKKVWWICEKKHTYQATIASRTGLKSGCPYCNGNKMLLGYNDFATKYPELLKYWDYDKNDIPPNEVSPNTQMSFWFKCEKGHSYKGSLKTLVRDKECLFCKNTNKNYYKLVGKSIVETNPEILKYWDYDRNKELGVYPEKITKGSERKVWFQCEKGHSYQKDICNMINRNEGCPYCNGKRVLSGFNDLATLRPEFLEYWDYDKNNELGIYPDKISVFSSKKVWWKCKLGHSFQVSLSNYRLGSCGICHGKKAVRNIETGEVFESAKKAAQKYNLGDGTTILSCCKGKQKTSGGYHWAYYEDYINKGEK